MFFKYVNAMKYLETIPDFLSMYGVFTSQSTSQIRQEMSIISYKLHKNILLVILDSASPQEFYTNEERMTEMGSL